METGRTTILLLAIAGVLATATAAQAQEPVATSLDALAARLHVGQSVWVIDTTGREVRGRLERISGDGIVLKADRVETLNAPDIREVRARRPDSLKNGALIGLAVGGALGTAWCAGAIADNSGDIDAKVECAEGFTVFPGLGALFGLAVDAAIPGKVRVVYRGSAGAKALTIAIPFSPSPRRPPPS